MSSLSFRTRRLPDKLRIVKPIEGSLTLHNWSRLATPHLGGVLEERCGVAIKGNDKDGYEFAWKEVEAKRIQKLMSRTKGTKAEKA